MKSELTVVKVGGSLFDMPDLGSRLQHWLKRLGDGPVLLVPGGGPMVNVVRDLDQRFRLGEEAAHWLALRAMTLNAHFLAGLLPCSRVIGDVVRLGETRGWLLLDAHAFAQADEAHPDRLPHSWRVTSDSIAARAAYCSGAGRLVLLKSVPVPADQDWAIAAQVGWVDDYFPEIIRRGPAIRLEGINFRESTMK